jgi:hypothetical protein
VPGLLEEGEVGVAGRGLVISCENGAVESVIAYRQRRMQWDLPYMLHMARHYSRSILASSKSRPLLHLCFIRGITAVCSAPIIGSLPPPLLSHSAAPRGRDGRACFMRWIVRPPCTLLAILDT